jgi:hypothetical protein
VKINIPSANRYSLLIEKIFTNHYRKGLSELPFDRDELISTAKKLKIVLPKNLGDVLYSIRYRMDMPATILATQTEGKEWIIDGRGKAQYAFCLKSFCKITPNKQLASIKIPDATPEIVAAYAFTDEQALLAKVRYNRLIDIFLGITAYSLQNHLRTSVKGLGQIETDELYVGIDKKGRQFILPVQAKGGKDKLSTVQTRQDFACCTEKFPHLLCRPVSVQFAEKDLIAIFELAKFDEEFRIVEERHYKLVPANQITTEDLKRYSV